MPTQQLTLNNPNWYDEYQKTQQMNNQINWMNEMLTQNPNNKAVQNALLEQYMGMVFPQAPDYENELNRALTLYQTGETLGIPELKDAGKNMLSGNPLTSQYFGQSATTDLTPEQKKLQDIDVESFKTKYTTEGVDNRDILRRNTQYQDLLAENPDLATQYFSYNPNAGERLAALTAYYSGMSKEHPFKAALGQTFAAPMAIFGGGKDIAREQMTGLGGY